MAEKLEIIITAKDEVTRTLGKIQGQLGDLVKTGLKVAAGGFVALGAGMAGAMKVAMDAERVQADLAATIASTGGKAGMTAEEVNALADSLAGVTRFSDETIVSAQSMLLTFTNIGEDVFPAATEAVLNMGEKFGSVESAAVQLGKALNDPVAGVGALREVGVSLTEEQAALVQSFMDAGDVASAQKVILDELGVEVGGLARAMGDTAEGKISRFKNRLVDVGQIIGAAVIPALTTLLDNVFLPGMDQIGRITEKVAGLINALLNFGPTSEEAARAFVQLFGYERWYAIWQIWQQVVGLGDVVKNFVEETLLPFVQDHMEEFKGAFIALAAVLGAIAIAAVITGIGAAIAGLLNPVTLLIAAIGVLGAAWAGNWLGIRDAVSGAVDQYIGPAVQRARDSLGVILPAGMEIARWTWENKLSPALQTAADSLQVILPAAVEIARYAWENVFKPALEAAWIALKEKVLPALETAIGTLTEVIPAAIELARAAWEDVLKPALEAIWTFITESLYPGFLTLSDWLGVAVIGAINTAVAAWNNVFKPAIEAVYNFINNSLWPVFQTVGTWLLTTLPNAINTAVGAFNTIKNTILDVINTISDLVSKIGTISFPDLNPFNAEGGYVPAGVPAMVGERGPEAFIPATSGVVVPNDMLSKLGGTTNYNLTIYSSAPAENVAADFNLMKAWAGA